MRPLPFALTLTTVGIALGVGIWVYFHPLTEQKGASPAPPGSTLGNVTLTEFDSQGNLIWEIKATKADYNEENFTATIVTVSGKFYRQGKVLIEATGKAGSVNQRERKITVDGDIKAKLLEENIELKADRLVWQADDDLLTATGNIQIQQPDRRITLVGKSLRATPSKSHFTLSQAVQVKSEQPPLLISTPALTWEAPQQIVRIDVPFQAKHQKEDLNLSAQKGVWQIQKQVLQLPQSAKLTAPQRGWELNSRNLEWRIQDNLVKLPQPLEIKSTARGYVVSSQQGMVNLAQQVIQLRGNVKAVSTFDQSQVTADRATWNIPQQLVTAEGNVFYQQAQSDLKVKGDRAVANLAQQTIEVSSTNAVETLVIPN
ncbi:MAG: LPS export ABC transporter periplasmic protein LptC [Pseudanabaenaceae cyanobacterium]